MSSVEDLDTKIATLKAMADDLSGERRRITSDLRNVQAKMMAAKKERHKLLVPTPESIARRCLAVYNALPHIGEPHFVSHHGIWIPCPEVRVELFDRRGFVSFKIYEPPDGAHSRALHRTRMQAIADLFESEILAHWNGAEGNDGISFTTALETPDSYLEARNGRPGHEPSLFIAAVTMAAQDATLTLKEQLEFKSAVEE